MNEIIRGLRALLATIEKNEDRKRLKEVKKKIKVEAKNIRKAIQGEQVQG